MIRKVNPMDPKVLFVKQFLATLFIDKVGTIPINNALFKQGMDRMAEYFDTNREDFGPYVNKIDLLFLKYSTHGDYSQFSKVIESFNGRLVSLENPYYVKANIRLEENYADELVRDNELGIDRHTMQEIANQFRIGAGLP